MALKDSDILNLPDAPGFISEPPHFTVNEIIRMCEPMLLDYNRKLKENPPPEYVGEPFRLIQDS